MLFLICFLNHTCGKDFGLALKLFLTHFFLQRRLSEPDRGPSAKCVVVDNLDAPAVVAALRQLPIHGLDFTTRQMQLVLKAFGKVGLPSKKKNELFDLLVDTLRDETCQLLNPKELEAARHDILF